VNRKRRPPGPSRKRRPGPKVGTDEWRARDAEGVRRSWDLVRRAAVILPADLRALRSRSGPFRPAVVALAAAAADEEQRLLAEIGGELASEQRRLLVRDVVFLGLLSRALVMQFAQTEDADLATRAGSLLGQRRSALQALGLERALRDVPDLRSYLAERANGGAPQIDAESVAEADPAADRPAQGNVASESEPEALAEDDLAEAQRGFEPEGSA